MTVGQERSLQTTNEHRNMTSTVADQRRSAMSVQRAQQELAHLRQEIQRIEGRLLDMRARAIKLEHYIEMAREFGDRPSARTNDTASSARSHDDRERAPRGGMSGRAVQECISILRERHEPIHTTELHALIVDRGIRLGGKNPAQALSGYLSRTPELVSNRSQGWSLREWEAESGQEAEFDLSTPPPK
jgi:hypothetical protein